MSIRIEENAEAIVVLNRAEKRGALSPEFYDAILEGCRMASQKRALILSGQGYFCAGGDLGLIRIRQSLPLEERRANIEKLHDVVRALVQAPVPTICAVEGGAAGAGLSLALACDLLVAAQGAQFAARYVNAGLTPDGGLTHSMAACLPKQLAMEMCLLGRPQSAERLHGLGVVTTLTEQGQAFAAARDLAAELAEGAGHAQSRIRALLRAAPDRDLEAMLNLEADVMAEAQGHPEAVEGISAFLEKRAPKFPRDRG